MALKIRNWHKFQHFKDRKPPWIKLYRDLLDDRSWYELSDSAAKLLISLWLLASEDSTQRGELPSIKEIAFRLRVDIRSIKSNLSKLSPWLEQDDINVISDSNAISSGYQPDPLETETYKQETETESSAERFTPDASASGEKRGNGKDPTPVIERIPLNDGTEYEVHESFVIEMDRLYPSVDVPATLREMRAWSLTNPANRKTVKGVNAFINRWLAKEQNKHG